MNMTNVFFIVVVFSITRFINNHPIHWVDYSSSGLITKVLILFSYLSVSIFLVNCSVSLNSNQSQLILLLSMFTTVIPLIYLMSFLPKKESSFIAVIASSQAQVKPEPEQAASPIQKEGIETVHQHGDFHNDTVWLDYINDEGGLTFKRIEYQSTHGDKFKAFCHLANGIRYFEFNKIHSIFDTKMLPIDRDAWISFHSND